ncbi:PD-(D/E)XK nuclease family protein [Neisseria sp. ZJ106]|uniref:PD-(D/E)XK nuclease family protein n=1 Tax=Neisseria lisongii TaxID=2912188 RepID=A0ABY7RKW0_9NEIS|nr:PD-(D/E)XK nuclease family protein [Neisseria lisongii]MCF7522111.1 PD-(D/E)XK nuclease family protein [Neisseria lisongii]WCL71948.1 PD-(D/E)XK nuclease family protein [Neisseria lisongii]
MQQHLLTLKKIAQIIEYYQKQRDKTALYDANRFNPFRFMRTDENGLSAILAFLLDPNQTHGQQDLFLNAFLKYLNLTQFLAYDSVSVFTEKTVLTKRRHDIFIEGYINQKLVWVISIENKLRDAVDQPNQLTDYLDDLKSKNDLFFLIYLPKSNTAPDKSSISETEWQGLIDRNQGKSLSIQHLIEWLDRTPIVAPKIRQFCDDFKDFLKEDIMNTPEDSNQLVQEIIKDKELLYTSLIIAQSTKELYQQLINQLEQKLKEKIKTDYPSLTQAGWELYTKSYFNKEINFNLYFDKDKSKQGKSWGISIGFDKTWFNQAFYGIYVNEKMIPASSEEYQKLTDFFQSRFQGFESTEWWLKRKKFDGELFSWGPEVLRQIPSGELANKLFEHLKPLLDAVIEYNKQV